MNWLDTAIVVFWLIGVLGIGVGENAQFLRMFRLAKLTRLLRLLRKMPSVDTLCVMSTALRKSVPTLFWSIAIFFTLQSFFALLLSQALSDFYIKDDSFSYADRKAIYTYFGTFTRA